MVHSGRQKAKTLSFSLQAERPAQICRDGSVKDAGVLNKDFCFLRSEDM